MISVIEQFSKGKKSEESNEDKIIVTKNFVAVLDGVTTKKCPIINKKSGGRFAVETAEKVIKSFAKDIDARQAIDALSEKLNKETIKYLRAVGDFESPAYVAAIYSVHRKEIWLVGDICLMTDGKIFPTAEKKIDDITSAMRAVVINIAISKGTSEAELLKHDVGREFIMPLLSEQHWLANNEYSKYGYGVINGSKVPDKFIQIFDVSDAKEIVMASDGYPKLFASLEESEKYLLADLAEDRLRCNKHKTTKGVMEGNCSFDDRSYIRIAQ